MNSKTLRLTVITPTGKPLDAETESLRLPAADGSVGIRHGHAAALILLKAGDVHYLKDGKDAVFPLKAEGFARIKDNVVTIITK